jgi:hypothetical protein
LRPALRNFTANGSSNSPRAIGKDSFPNGLLNGSTVAVVGTLTVRTTVVVPDPAGIVLGLNDAFAPEGNPERLSCMACGKVCPLAGAKVNVNTACPPGDASTLAPLDPVEVIVIVPIVSAIADEDVAAM